MRATVCVINDLSTDQRVHKHCVLLAETGYHVSLVGRVLPSSAPLSPRTYSTTRFRLPWHRGPLFYAVYNIRLLMHLLRHRPGLVFSNDLDTLPASYMAARLIGAHLIYDSHEFFTEVPELEGRFARKVWLWLERMMLPKLKHAFTVNRSIADEYEKRYGLRMGVIRNVPSRIVWPDVLPTRSELGLPEDKTLIVLQGAGINMHRGAEEAVSAMRHLNDAMLLIIGTGDVIETLKQMVDVHGIHDRVRFTGRMPYEQMMFHTRLCDIGLTLDRDTNLNYRYSLPNKVFDYIQACVPILATDLPEVSRVVVSHDVGMTINGLTSESLAQAIETMRNDSQRMTTWRRNCQRTAGQICWENETIALKNLLRALND